MPMPRPAGANLRPASAHAPQPLLVGILRPLARLYGDRGQWKAASRTLAALLARADTLTENDRVEARLRGGEAKARLGDPAGAAVEFRRVLDEKPGHLDATLGPTTVERPRVAVLAARLLVLNSSSGAQHCAGASTFWA